SHCPRWKEISFGSISRDGRFFRKPPNQVTRKTGNLSGQKRNVDLASKIGQQTPSNLHLPFLRGFLGFLWVQWSQILSSLGSLPGQSNGPKSFSRRKRCGRIQESATCESQIIRSDSLV